MTTVYSKKSAARTLGVSTETIDRARRAGKLPYRLIGRRVVFLESDLNTFLDACAISARALATSREKLEMEKAIGGQK